ncbi:CBS domain-containing protein [Arthroderma uncinatum]|uniref:CBS domain-containing protein n=1 Tax=Arthroderma uncinatum TaxID=74035 RepID=UPI00144ACFDD|nr:CBS domain-containing protein [Arthroderma uncinatum]KAF3491007.1 CBS domain-containing protein [Arthroderma uncinatum]
MQYDRESGQVYTEQVIRVAPSASKLRGSSWVHESPLLPKGWEAHSQTGAHSLKHMAMRAVLADQRTLTPLHFEDVPWSTAKYLWECVSRSKRTSLYLWKIFAAAYTKEFNKVAHRYSLKPSSKEMPISDYLKLISSKNLDWAAVLSVSAEFFEPNELLDIANVTNLTALEIRSQPRRTEFEYEPITTISDRVIRGWSEMALAGSAFGQLRILVLRLQPGISEHIFAYLDAFRSLTTFIMQGCSKLYRKEARELAAKHGWESYTVHFSDCSLYRIIMKLGSELEPKSQDNTLMINASPVVEFSLFRRNLKPLDEQEEIIFKRKATRQGRPGPGKRKNYSNVAIEAAKTDKRVKPVLRENRREDMHGLLAQFTSVYPDTPFHFDSLYSVLVEFLPFTRVFPVKTTPPGAALKHPDELKMSDKNTQPATGEAGQEPLGSPRLSSDSRSSSSRSSSLRRDPPSNATPAKLSHRQSLGESLRGVPSSPRARRQPSFTQAAVQSLIDNPPSHAAADPAFSGRDWTQISIGELVQPVDLKFVDADTAIEDATNLLIDSSAHSLLIRESPGSSTAVGTFGYADLNAYLLLVVGLIQPSEEEQVASLRELARRAREGEKIPLKDVKGLGMQEPLTTLPESTNLMTAVETFGGGVHRIIVVKEGTTEIIGVFTQWKLVKFLWENGRSFPVIEQLYPQHLRELRLGSHCVISINGDRPLCHALELMNNEGVSSLAVVDNQWNVVGNISVVDVKLLTKSTSLPLLHNTCIHFISVILSTRGIIEGQDSFPVFHINPQSTLAHTVAKLVATRSHRMWVTDPHSPASSAPSTPSHSSANVQLGSSNQSSSIAGPAVGSTGAQLPSPSSANFAPGIHGNNTHQNGNTRLTTNPISPFQHPKTASSASYSFSSSPPTFTASISTSIPASALPGASLSGRLVGVVSLTDILNLYARASGLYPTDPNANRTRRRRSSSSSLGFRRSGELAREIWNRP